MVSGDPRAPERSLGGISRSRKQKEGEIMTATEQARLATVEEHVRGENARDMDVVMSTFSNGEHVCVAYNGIPTKGHRQDPPFV